MVQNLFKLVAFVFVFMQPVALANTNLVTQANKVFEIELKGLIHIGASTGQEEADYKKLNIPNVLWIEADPDTYKMLVKNVKPDGSQVICANFAVSNQDGTATLFVTNNKDSSSLLELKDHKIIHKTVLSDIEINVPTKRLDNYFLEAKIDPKKYNVMVIDIQGAELMALEGAVDTLNNISCIVSEVNYSEVYSGAVKIWELDNFLFKHGFVRVDTGTASRIQGDALYIRKDILEKIHP